MASSNQKLRNAAFFQKHPRCCYCGGRRAAVERDHAPARVVFRGKHGPEDFEFPSCSDCNRSSALSEQVTAFYIRSIDQAYEKLDRTEYKRLISGVVNNAPEALPYQDRFKPPKSYIKAIALAAEDRTVSLPQIAKDHLELFGTKMLYDMYYRVTGSIPSSSLRRIVTWAQAGSPAANQIRHNASNWFGDLQVGKRSNVDLGAQFHYQTGYNEAHGYLGLHMSFGEALVYFASLAPHTR